MNYIYPVALLALSNVFMTFAWYGHLRFTSMALWIAVFGSWSIALVEYWLAIPANRIGFGVYSLPQLKTIQEVITLIVFVGFSYFWFGEEPTIRTIVGFSLIAVGASIVFAK